MAEKQFLTKKGYDERVARLEELKVVRRKEVAQKLKEAREQGDLSENAEYDAAKDENKLRKTLARIESLATEYGVEKFVIGFPKHMNNDIGERAEKALEFGEMLKRRTGIEIVMWDERLTTVEAERTLMESGVRRENRKQYVDQIAAVFILQGYLDSLGMQK